MNDAYRLDTGEVPLLVSMPHCGTALTPGCSWISIAMVGHRSVSDHSASASSQ